jgi:osmotically-inducible protein OsmY
MDQNDDRRRMDEQRTNAGSRGRNGPRGDDRWRETRTDDERRYGAQRPQFTPDWSRGDAQPFESSEQYYARNRDYDRSHDFWEHGQHGGWQGDQGRTTTAEQRDRGFVPREQYDREHHAHGGQDRFAAPWSTGPHTGRGPKGYKRSDDQIVEEASQRLEHDGHVDASEIEVTAENGVVHLRGTVHDREMKRRAERCIESVYGVHDVMNELSIGGGPHRDDQSQSRDRSWRQDDARGKQPH